MLTSVARYSRVNRRCDNQTAILPAVNCSLQVTVEPPSSNEIPCDGYDCPVSTSPSSNVTSLTPVPESSTSSLSPTDLSPGETSLSSIPGTSSCYGYGCAELPPIFTSPGIVTQGPTCSGSKDNARPSINSTEELPVATSIVSVTGSGTTQTVHHQDLSHPLQRRRYPPMPLIFPARP